MSTSDAGVEEGVTLQEREIKVKYERNAKPAAAVTISRACGEMRSPRRGSFRARLADAPVCEGPLFAEKPQRFCREKGENVPSLLWGNHRSSVTMGGVDSNIAAI